VTSVGSKPVRSLFPLEDTPGLISLLAGKPNAGTFPFTSLSFTVKSPLENGQDVTLTLDQEDMAEGLQYSATAGLPRLVDWLVEGTSRASARKTQRRGMGHHSRDWIPGSNLQGEILFHHIDHTINVTSAQAIIGMVNPGDSVLVELPVYL
jgi:tryptophan aminotransferase